MQAIRMMYIVGMYILGAPIILAFTLAVTMYYVINYRRIFGYWHGAFDNIGEIWSGLLIGAKISWNWAKTGELDLSPLY